MTDRVIYKNNFIDLDIERTLNIYSNKSASGKTYLPYYVQYFKDFPRIFVMPNELSYKEFIKTPWRAGDEAIYFFDRFDMFGNVQLLDILKNNLNVCCLLDCKNSEILFDNNVPFKIVYLRRVNCNYMEVKNDILF